MEAYSIFLGACKFFRAGSLPPTRLEVYVMDEASGQPLTDANVALDGTLRLVTDPSGGVVFRGFSPRIYRLVVSADGYTGEEITVDTSRRKRIVIELNPTETHVPKDVSKRAVFFGSG